MFYHKLKTKQNNNSVKIDSKKRNIRLKEKNLLVNREMHCELVGSGRKYYKYHRNEYEIRKNTGKHQRLRTTQQATW